MSESCRRSEHSARAFDGKRFLLGPVLILIGTGPALGALPTKAEERTAVIGQPVALAVQPATITLTGPRATQQLVVTGRYADGTVRDLTPFCEMAVETADVVDLGTGGFLLPLQNGTTTLAITAGGQTARVPVTV